jgi:hypothetical protein
MKVVTLPVRGSLLNPWRSQIVTRSLAPSEYVLRKFGTEWWVQVETTGWGPFASIESAYAYYMDNFRPPAPARKRGLPSILFRLIGAALGMIVFGWVLFVVVLCL